MRKPNLALKHLSTCKIIQNQPTFPFLMSKFNPPQTLSYSNLDSAHTSEDLAQSSTNKTKTLPTTITPTEVNETHPPTFVEISATSENDPATSSDWFNLSRKLREQNRELLGSIGKLKQSLAESQQQLKERGQQVCRKDFLITQQTTKIDAIKTQFQTAQTQIQQQKDKLTTLQEKLITIQSQLTNVERQYTLFKQRYREKADRFSHSQKQIEELQMRLQRQQRYTLQYKAALDECLSKSARKQVQSSMNSLSLDRTFTPKINSIKTWSEEPKTQKVSSSILSEIEPGTPLEQIANSNLTGKSGQLSSLEDSGNFGNSLSPAPKITEIVNKIKTDTEVIIDQENMKSTLINSDSELIASRNIHLTQELAVHSPVTVSFDIDCDKLHNKAKIELPSFLSRQN